MRTNIPTPKGRLLAAIRPAVAAGVALVLLSGCVTQIRPQLEESIAARKVESRHGWEDALLDGKPLIKNLQMRTAVLFRNFDSVTAETDGDTFKIKANTKQARAGSGSAVPIAKDGYFLTAGHVVRHSPSLTLLVFLPQENGRPLTRKLPARIVWMPDDPERRPDIAVVHADVGPLKPFPVADKLPQVETPIVIAGWPFGFYHLFSGGSPVAAGRILSLSTKDARGSSPAYLTVHHDAPVVSGDSGGPVLDRDGNLIGVNYSFDFSFWQGLAIALGRAPPPADTLDYFASAIMPDPDWLREVIQRDRQRTPDSPVKPAR